MNLLASKILGENVTWEEDKAFKTSDLTLKYVSLYKIAMSNWWPTTHPLTIALGFACLLYNVGKGVQTNLGQLIFGLICSLQGAKWKNQRLVFPSLIYEFLSLNIL